MKSKKTKKMEAIKKEKVKKLVEKAEVKVLNSNKDALPKALLSFNKAFSEYYKNFIL